MAIFAFDGTANFELGRACDFDGAALHPLGKMFDFDGAALHELFGLGTEPIANFTANTASVDAQRIMPVTAANCRVNAEYALLSDAANAITVNSAGAAYFDLTFGNVTGYGLTCSPAICVNGALIAQITVGPNATARYTGTHRLAAGDVITFYHRGGNAGAYILAGSLLRWNEA